MVILVILNEIKNSLLKFNLDIKANSYIGFKMYVNFSKKT